MGVAGVCFASSPSSQCWLLRSILKFSGPSMEPDALREVDIFHPLATLTCNKCSSLPVAMERCQAVYHDGTVYVSNEPVTTGMHEYRIYDYSMAKNIWNIIPTDFWRFSLATYNSQAVLVLKIKEEGRSLLHVELKVFPLTGDREDYHIGVANMTPVASTVAVGYSDMLIIADYNLKVFSKNAKQREFSLPSPSVTHVPLEDVYFSVAFHRDHLYLTPTPKSHVFRRHGCPKVFYISLNQIKSPSQSFSDDLNIISFAKSSQSRKRTRPASGRLNQNVHKRARSEPPNIVYEENQPSKHVQLKSSIKSLSRMPGELSKHQTERCKKERDLEWKELESIPDHDHSNLAVFGKRLITTIVGKRNGLEILAYSPTVKHWLPVANTGDSIPHRIQETTIVPLGHDHTNQLMLIGGTADGVPMRDVYKVHLTVQPYNPKNRISLQALYKLEAGEREIKVITKLKPKLHDFREKAQIHELYAFRYGPTYPIVDIYINSWLEDPQCNVPPTWENFLALLRDIELGDIAEEISTYLTSTSPTPIPTPTAAIEEEVEAEASKDNEDIPLQAIGITKETEDENMDNLGSKEEVSELKKTVQQLTEEVKELQSRLKSHDEQFQSYQVKFAAAAVYGSYSAHGSGPVLRDMSALTLPNELPGSRSASIEGSWCQHYPDGVYSEPSFNDLRHEVASKIPEQWKEIGYNLGLKHEELEDIEKEKDTDKERFTKVFVLWRKQGGYEGVCDYKWIKLLEALNKIREYRLTDELRKRLTPKTSASTEQNTLVPC